MKDTLWHVNFGDNDNSFVMAPDKETARERMPEGKEMVNYAVRMDALYQQIFKAGQKEMAEWIEKENPFSFIYRSSTTWQTKLKEWEEKHD